VAATGATAEGGGPGRICGAGDAVTVIANAGEEMLPSGFATVMFAVPGVATSLDGIAAVSCVLLVKVVTRRAPFHNTVAPG